jgi:adenine phosphoribosyltransferase
MTTEERSALQQHIRDVPDFPKPGILFKDITPMLLDAEAFRLVIQEFVERARSVGCTKVAGIDARGFLFGATVAFELGVGFVPIRKKGKLPAETIGQSYALEYGEAEIEIHRDALGGEDRVVLVDDLLATGGTAAAALSLIERAGARACEALFLIELAELGGREKLAPHSIHSLLVY